MRALRSAFLRAGIPQSVANNLPASFEIMGDVAVLEIEKSIVEKYKDAIVKALLSVNNSIRVILNKTNDVDGIYRIAKYDVLFVKENRTFKNIPKIAIPKKPTETIHREAGSFYFLDISKVFFTSKLGFERERIAKQVLPGEKILVLFAGIGPFAICIAKHSQAEKVVGVEINREAVKYFKINVGINKLQKKVFPILGNAENIEFSFKFDRIVMPAPKNAPDFLEHTLGFAKESGCYIHLYTFASEEEIKEGLKEKEIEERVKKIGYNCQILSKRKCGPVGPRNYRFVVDFKVWK